MRAQTFDQLQANIKNMARKLPAVATPHWNDDCTMFAATYVAECIRLGIIGGSRAAMRNTMTLACARVPLAQASWEREKCPGSGGYMPQGIPTACPHCFQIPAAGSAFRPDHQRNGFIPVEG